MNYRLALRASATLLALLVISLASPANAHVLLDAVRPHSDGTVDLVFSFDHGCVGQVPTNELILTVPDHTAVIATHEPPGWKRTTDGPTITWTGPAIPDGERAEFIVTARVGSTPGSTVTFPVIQKCDGAAPYNWTDPDDSASFPAPRFVATAATIDPTLQAPPRTAEPGRSGPVAVGIAIGALVAFTALGTWAAGRSRRRST